ncbi:MAG: hypothetical protein V7K38_08855 [Nostoc sp.]|uniref:hypothetical protein n=1 Tax=Nostoc sp. TaxID=1180 RepID=UPI002FF6C7B3
MLASIAKTFTVKKLEVVISLEQVNKNWDLLNLLLNEKNEHLPSLVLAMKMLSNALDLQKGLYITF